MLGEDITSPFDRCVVERDDYLAMRADALVRLEAKTAPHQRLRAIDGHVVESLSRTHHPADLEHVAKARGDQQPGLCASAFDQGIGAGGRSVYDLADARRIDSGFGDDGANSIDHAGGAVLRRSEG